MIEQIFGFLLQQSTLYIILIILIAALLALIVFPVKRKVSSEEEHDEFIFRQYDNNGGNTLELIGKTIERNLDTNQRMIVKIDEKEIIQTQNTSFVFRQKGIRLIKSYSNSTADYRLANHYVKDYTKLKGIQITSTSGIPIAIYEGDDVHIDVENGMAKISIDGKLMYLYKINYIIFDTDAIKPNLITHE